MFVHNLRAILRSTYVLATIAALVPVSFGQTKSNVVSNSLPGHDPITRSLRVNVNLVLVPVIVTDELHRPVLGLKQQNFELYESEEPQHLLYFYQQDAPISIALLIDISGSMSNNFDALREAIDQFLINANPLDDYTVVTVSDRPEVLVRGSQSIDEIQATLATLKPAGWTALLDSIRVAAMALKTARYPRRAILIVSDGLDNVSRHHLKDVAAFIEESDLDVYAIGIVDDALPFFGILEERIDKKLLMRITDVTGGHTIIVEDIADLPRIAARLSQVMRSEYVLGYRPTDGGHTRKWRSIKVRITAPGGNQYLASYKKRYFTPGE